MTAELHGSERSWTDQGLPDICCLSWDVPVPRAVSKIHPRPADRAFAVAAPQVWNSLSVRIRQSELTSGQFTVNAFCRRVSGAS